MASDSLLQTRGLGRRLPGDAGRLFGGVSLELRRGECIGIVGPTGAGKTLLLRALALLDAVDEGEVLWQGAPVSDRGVPAFRARVMYLHQRPVLFPGSVEENLRQPFRLAVHRRKGFERSRAVRLLGELGRPETLLSAAARDLSGGEGQVVALVRALQLDPDVLLLDEPTSALDARTTRAVEEVTGRWLREAPGRAAAWVSHDPEQVGRVAQATLALDQLE